MSRNGVLTHYLITAPAASIANVKIKWHQIAIPLDMYNLIIRIDALDRHYPGGFSQFRKDNEEFIEGDIQIIWFDDHIIRDGAMSAHDIEQAMEEYETYGLRSFEGDPNNPTWIDMCIVPTFGTIAGRCDWLELLDPRQIKFTGKNYG